MKIINRKLMGFNKKQVDKYLEKANKFQENEINLIKENIETCKIEINSLVQELNVLQEEQERYAKNKELLELALTKTNEYSNLIDAAAQKDVAKIQEDRKQKLKIHNNYLTDIDYEIVKLKSQMSSMLQEVQELIIENEDAGDTESDPVIRKVVGTILPSASKSEITISTLGNGLISETSDIIGKTVVLPNGVLIGRVKSLIINEATNGIEGFYLKGNQLPADKPITADCVIAVKKDSLVVSADWQKISRQSDKSSAPGKDSTERLDNLKSIIKEQMTADGAIAPKAINTGKRTKYLADFGLSDEAVDSVSMGDIPPDPQSMEMDLGEGQSGFWDNDDEEDNIEASEESNFNETEITATDDIISISPASDIPAEPQSIEMDLGEDREGFWGNKDAEDDMEENITSTTGELYFNKTEKETVNKPQPSATETLESESFFSESGSYFDETETASTVEPSLPDNSHDTPVSQDHASIHPEGEIKVSDYQARPQAAAPKSSPAVDKEIKTVRHKYVVGKLAGEDLLDNNDQIIISKNELITAAIIDKAEKEGKLAELIIHMVIPGLEE
ncbi:MAG: hypothetical protein A4E55_02455 [Pelotomaculum sp. PtaU1.Bin035]|nr:MAG: hypothetical protein A4E55_02455 [Pelotomaculum sp. PtaU1.Bin035]